MLIEIHIPSRLPDLTYLITLQTYHLQYLDYTTSKNYSYLPIVALQCYSANFLRIRNRRVAQRKPPGTLALTSIDRLRVPSGAHDVS